MEELSKNYDSEALEPRILDKWLTGGYYARRPGVGDCTVTIPPPNVTGVLHMGHAMDDTIQDTIIRFNRMRGVSTRWILGTDHAGIATQTKVDKKLAAQGISRRELGREKFINACWDWTHEYGGHIIEQIKRMGCSVDFDDPHFTMDPEYATAVRKVFCDWYHDGLIYRGKRIVNWCPTCGTAISDDEAEYQEEDGHLWHLRYPLVEPIDGVEYIVVATTRPETMLGDTGVAVSPKDHDKDKFVGAKVKLPIVDREIPIFSDFYVDANFGSGFVKVTPAHDPNDFAMGERHGLEKINIFDETAHVVEGYGEFTGMSREECREAVVAWFEEHGLLDHVEDHHHSVMHCYRCPSALEPWLSEQWFVAVDKLKGPATEAVTSGEVTFHPARWTQTYLTWMENLKDWCISRQLWWGHRIPVFYCADCGWEDACMEDVDVCPKCGGHHVHQDEDVLDTWFSSQLWTFATQGWPNHPEQLEGHHPTTALVTARDIIALWVARMIMSSTYFLGEIPFHDVVIYATILAKDGSRMSKSKGNAVDPMEALRTYGADAIRWYFYSNSAPWLPNRFHGKAVQECQRKFLGTLWNTYAFFVLYANIDGFDATKYTLDYDKLGVMDRWLLSRLNSTVREVDDDLAAYRIPETARALEQFVDELSNWYVRRSRERFWGKGMPQDKINAYMTLYTALVTTAKIAAPMIPFMTEEIYRNLVCTNDPSAPISVHLCDFPAVDERCIDKALETRMEDVIDIVVLGRAARNGASCKIRQPLARMYVQMKDELLPEDAAIIADELNLKAVERIGDASAFMSYIFKPQLKTVGPKYGRQLAQIREALSALDGTAAKAELDKTGTLTILDGAVVLTPDDLLIETAQTDGFYTVSDNGITVAIDTRLTPQLIEEGFVRELVSKLQTMRKEAGFEVTDTITVYADGNDRIAKILTDCRDSVLHDVMGTALVCGQLGGFQKEQDINGEHVTLGVEKNA